MRRKKGVVDRAFFSGLISVALIFAFSVIPVQSAEKTPIKIGITVPLSGPLAYTGVGELNAIKLAAKKFNDQGGILGGRKIELVVYDDKAIADEAVSTIKKLISRDRVVACVTATLSTPTLAQKEVTKEAKMIHMVAIAQHPKITEEGHPYLFRLNTTISMGGDALCQFVISRLKPQTAWYIGINDDFGRGMAEQYKANFEKAGIKFLGFEYYNKDDTDFTVYLTKAKSLNPDIIMMSAPSDAISATILKQKKQLGIACRISQGPGMLNPTMVNLAGAPTAEGVYSADSWVKTLDNPENKWFVENYEKEYKPLPVGKVETAAFESIVFLLQAMEKAGSTDGDKIAGVLRTTTFHGPRGKLTFDKIGQAIVTDYPIVVKNGQVVLAE